MFARQEESDHDVQIDTLEEDMASNPEVPDPYEKVYSNMPRKAHKLKPVPDCSHCGAKRFAKEPPGFCCHSGKFELNVPVILDQLMRLWTTSDVDARHFHNNISFLYCHLDSATANIRNNGIYTFHAHGMIYHNIRSFGREYGKEPRHLELYFYDDDPSLEHQYQRDWWPSFVTAHTYNIRGVCGRLNNSRTMVSHLTLISNWIKGHTMCQWLQRWLLFGLRVVNSLVSFRIVLSCKGKIGLGMSSDHTMDAMMLFHNCSSSLAVSLDGMWISQRKVLLWRMSTWLVPCTRLIVVQKKK
uniref:UPI0001A87829 related cluster n=1 Tax=Saccharum spontaneum TaxID=62335 RepID=A0A678TPZ7_SACSP|nr:UPI0001A87829 related cluster [Saccharum spontaneum]